jgi:hypothetical protein
MLRLLVSGFALAAALAFAAGPLRAEEPDPLAPGPEREVAEMDLAFRVPGGVDPGPSLPLGAFGGRSLGFFFGLPGRSPVKVRVETFPFLEDAEAFARRRKFEARTQCREVEAEAAFEGGGFDRGIRIAWKPDAQGEAAVLLVLRRFRQVAAVTCEFLAAEREAYARPIEALLGSFRALARAPRGLPLPAGWRAEAGRSFEIATDAPPAASKALADLLEAASAEARRWFPAARTPEFPALVMFFGTADGFAAFREEHGIPPEALAFEDDRVLALGVLPQNRQTRRFAVAEVDILETVRALFDQFALRAAGRRPEAWFTEGTGLALGAGFGSDGKFDRKRAEAEIALSIEEELSTRMAPSLEALFDKVELTDPEKLHAAAWDLFLHSGAGQAKKEILQKYLAGLAAGALPAGARKEAFGKENWKDLSGAAARAYLQAAAKARKGK